MNKVSNVYLLFEGVVYYNDTPGDLKQVFTSKEEALKAFDESFVRIDLKWNCDWVCLVEVDLDTLQFGTLLDTRMR